MFGINPFTAPALKKLWAEKCTHMPANSIFPILCQTNLILILCVLMRLKRGENKAYGFQILSFYQSFSNDIVAVKGLSYLASCVEFSFSGSNACHP